MTAAALDIALNYVAKGWNPVPIEYRCKKPNGDSWQLRIIDASNAAQYFNSQRMNIGVILGPSSHGLTDVDLDCEEALAIGPYILPPTGAIFGRASSRAAHRLYYTDLAIAADKAVLNFNDPKTGGRMLELRIGGDRGAQTVFPGSTHEETGEAIAWEENGEPASVDGDKLARCVHDLAAYALIARYWPASGLKARHNAALIVGGFLARAGKNPQQIKIAAEAIARAAGDNKEWRNRREAAEDAAAAYHAGDHAYGLTGMRKQFGDEVADQVAEWLGYDASGERQQENLDEYGYASEQSSEQSETPLSNARRRLLQSSKEFVASYVPLDYLVDGLILEAFLYSLTGATGAGKTTIALRLAASVALGIKFANRETKKRRVLYLAAENPEDTRMRWIALAQQMDFDADTIEVYFVEGVFKISQMAERLKEEATALGGEFGLVVVDTSPVFYEGDDENSRTQQGKHAEMLRSLIDIIPGRPAIIANCHPVKNATPDNLLPAGGGNFLNSVDANLTAAKTDSTTELHWQGKFRGPDFAPLHFMLRTVTHERLVTSQDPPRLIPTVVCDWISDTATEEIAKQKLNDEDLILAAIEADSKASQASLAIKMKWTLYSGEPNKMKASRVLKALKGAKLITETRTGKYRLTDEGKKALKSSQAGGSE